VKRGMNGNLRYRPLNKFSEDDIGQWLVLRLNRNTQTCAYVDPDTYKFELL
jgi:hypothetical protein